MTTKLISLPTLIADNVAATMVYSRESIDFFTTMDNELIPAIKALQQQQLYEYSTKLSVSVKWQTNLDKTIIMAIKACDLINVVLHQQNGGLTVEQMEKYEQWYDITAQLGSYQQLVGEGNTLEFIYENLNKLLLSNQNANTLNELLNEMNQTQTDLRLHDWEFVPILTFDSFVGRQKLIEELKLFVNLTVTNDRYQMILLVGPPGVGKSQLAQAMMQKFAATKNYILNMSELQSPYIGETEKMLKKLFQQATTDATTKTAIFFDEADEIFKLNVPPHLKSIAMVIQTALQGTVKLDNNVLIIAATNYRDLVSAPMLDRISNITFIDVPETLDRFLYLLNVTMGGGGGDDSNSTSTSTAAAAETWKEEYRDQVIEQLIKKFLINVHFEIYPIYICKLNKPF
nr:hypothetical protein [Microctonus hyperodae filamentous virus]